MISLYDACYYHGVPFTNTVFENKQKLRETYFKMNKDEEAKYRDDNLCTKKFNYFLFFILPPLCFALIKYTLFF